MGIENRHEYLYTRDKMINREKEHQFLTLKNWLTSTVLRVRLKENLRPFFLA